MAEQKILVVDDIPENISLLYDFLLSHGYQIFIALDGEHAIELAQRVGPDLILLDVLMPGIDGFETCRRLKAEAVTRDIPVIFMTALDDAADRAEGLTRGGVDYVTKPFQQDEMLSRVRTQLDLGRLRARADSARAEARHLSELLHGVSDYLETLNRDLDALHNGGAESAEALLAKTSEVALRARLLHQQIQPFARPAAAFDSPEAARLPRREEQYGDGWGSGELQ